MVTWDDPIKIEMYTKDVQKMADEVIKENNLLKKTHNRVIDETIELMGINRLKEEGKWTEKMNEIKDIVHKGIAGRDAQQCNRWLTHINYQLYKALEFQYRMGLESLNQNLPELSTDLIFRNKKMEFRPSFEALKLKYYNEISKFITFPLKFQGVGGSAKAYEVFKTMPHNNSHFMHTVYIKAEELFD